MSSGQSASTGYTAGRTRGPDHRLAIYLGIENYEGALNAY